MEIRFSKGKSDVLTFKNKKKRIGIFVAENHPEASTAIKKKDQN
jgi:hypothetical protein